MTSEWTRSEEDEANTEPAPRSIERGLRLVLLPDPEARARLDRPLLGIPLAQRSINAALEAGFVEILAAPGLAFAPAQIREVPVGDIIDGPGLMIYEGTFLDPQLLRLMVEHPLEDDERYTLYDGVARPAGFFAGELGAMPATMPVSEELLWPDDLGPDDIARVVYDEDVERAEWLVLRTEARRSRTSGWRGTETEHVRRSLAGESRWHREISIRTLRWLARSNLAVAQLELLALGVALASGPVCLVHSWPTLILAGVLLLLGVHVSRLLAPLRFLRDEAINPRDEHGRPEVWVPGDTLAGATRPLAHAILTACLTYVLVAETDRSNVAALVLLVTGGVAALLSLAHARSRLRGDDANVLELPRSAALVKRLGVSMPTWLQGAPLLEICAALGSLTGEPGVPWTVLVTAALSRLWKWFTAPPPA
ncbi:hypothetical protein G6O69_13750 [Pseudenhygromyxa sp. WMMC2535]|uniref:hypothetical protein n=1 Tax=Pseudenhygromyxa sp. WMMC2535 TaxID=2712867 RepID=UPI001552C98F|nr:hypothetical protein [Pseudenhygromyxa sp. WMMC2535]NVB38901.1 hypothetical protein [Pseudenhygromyxa sp. WMMC2535]